ncbi:hypothetical protein CSW59_06880 [Caulobacter sp. BP25]|nr:hypothetical protein CSW59_06880 [Caulobacter sp. BP25]
MPRARGANARFLFALESAYGVPPEAGAYHLISLVSEDLGEDQQRIASDLLGRGRLPQKPADGPIDNRGSITAPVDARLFGLWLTLLLGPPTTTQGVAASGKITFAANPSTNDTITVGGQAFTFKSANPGANQILIGATLAETLRNAVWALNKSTVGAVAAADYGVNDAFTAITVTHGAVGTDGNAFALAASAATPSGATLSGGSSAGPYNHVFKAGAQTLPSASIEVGATDVADYRVNYGVLIDTMTIAMSRSGLLNATLGYIAQGEKPKTGASIDADPEVLEVDRFSQFSGSVELWGVPMGSVVSAQVSINNGLDVDEGIRRDGRIGGADPGAMVINPQLVTRFGDQAVMDLSTSGESVAMSYGWSLGANKRLTFKHRAVVLPRPKAPITAPGFIQATFDTIGHQDASGQALDVVLVNDVASYA